MKEFALHKEYIKSIFPLTFEKSNLHLSSVNKNRYSETQLITNTSEEFIKCRLDNFSMSFILYYVNFSICENK